MSPTIALGATAAAEQAPAGIGAPAWGPLPTVAEVEAHVAAHPPLRWASLWATGAPWLRLSGNGDLSVIYLAIVDGVVRARFGGLPEWHELEFGRAGMWRPITAQGEATDERDAEQLAIVEAQLRGAKATIAELLRADDEEKAMRESRWSAHLADVERIMAERDAARAIVNGRASPPTETELVTHHARGGLWRCVTDSFEILGGDRRPIHDARIYIAELAVRSASSRWWSLDAEGRPCAWPVVEGER